jgi:phosphoribosyl-AMP cyclohydrolase / phosphoribosyl-ATP pyrophosphohydrolase
MNIQFDKGNGLVPVIIQHHTTLQVLMLGYMNAEAYEKTMHEKKVCFFSRSKNRLWTKGETSGHFLQVVQVMEDCDNDTLLILARPEGPTCHTGATSCFKEETAKGFIYELETTIGNRAAEKTPGSYTAALFEKGINKIAQKLGEEAVELIIEAKDQNPALFKNEAADLLYHFLVLLQAKEISFTEVEAVLKNRHIK